MLRYLDRNAPNVGLGTGSNAVVSCKLDLSWCARAGGVAASTAGLADAATGWSVAVAFAREVGKWGVRFLEDIACPCA